MLVFRKILRTYLMDDPYGKMCNRGVMMYRLMHEGIMRKVFDSIQTIHEADVENDYLSTNLNIENLNFESTWEVEILKKHSTMTFWMQRKICKLDNLYNSFG